MINQCPENTQCRNCENYSWDKKIGVNNVRGSNTESGICSAYNRPTYAIWFGHNNKQGKEESHAS